MQYNSDCDTSSGCSPWEVLLYAQGSFNPQVLNTNYYDKTTTRMTGRMSTTAGSAINCVEDAYTYCVTVNVTDGDR